MALEGLVLAHPTKSSITLNGSTWGLEELDVGNPERRSEFVSSIDASGSLPFRVAPRENREVTARIRLIDAASMDAAMDAIGDLERLLEDAERLAASDPDDPVLDLVRLVYTPAGSTYSYSLIVYAAEIQDVPRTLSGEDAGFFLKRPVVTIRALCDPYAYGAGLTSPTKTTWLDTTIQGAALATSVKIPEDGSIGGDVSPWIRLSIEDKASLSRNRIVAGVRKGEGITTAAFDSDGMTLVNGTRSNVFLSKFGTAGSGDGQLNGPAGIAVDSSGNIYVADTSNNRVQKFDSSGNYVSKFGTIGTGNGQFRSIVDLDLDASGNIYTVELSAGIAPRVQKFDSSGNYVSQFGSLGTGNGQFSLPRGIAVDSSGNIYVADTGNHRIQKFSPSGTFVSKFGTNGSGNGQFSSPNRIAVDSSGNIYVADTGNHRIQKFDSSGNYVSKFGTNGSGNGQFSSPQGIALDATGATLVADAGNSRIQKFDSSGTFLSKFGSAGSGDGQFGVIAGNYILGITPDPSGNILVADSVNSRIQKFSRAVTLSASSTTWSIAASIPEQTRTGSFRVYLANATSESDGYARLIVSPSGGARRTTRSVYLTNGTVRDADLGEINLDTPWNAWIETIDSAKFTGVILVPTDSFIEVETAYGSGGAQPIGQISLSDSLKATAANINGRSLTAGADSGSWSTAASSWSVVNISSDDYGARRSVASMTSPAIALAGTGDYLNTDTKITFRAGFPSGSADIPTESTPFIGTVVRYKDANNYVVAGLAHETGIGQASFGVWKVKAGLFYRLWRGTTRTYVGTSTVSGGNTLITGPSVSATFQTTEEGQFYVGLRWTYSYIFYRGPSGSLLSFAADESTNGFDGDLADGAALGNSTAAQVGLFDYQTSASPTVTREWREFQISGNAGGDGPSGLVAVTPPPIPATGKITLTGSKLLTKYGGEYPYLGSSGIELSPDSDNNLTIFARQSSSQPGAGSSLSENLDVKVDGWRRFLSVPHSAGSIGI